MTAYATTSERRFVRDADRAILGGVCAGIARYFGFGRCIIRAIFIITCLVAPPFAAVAYIAIVLLVPAESSSYEYVVEREVRHRRRRMSRRERKRARRESKRANAEAMAREEAEVAEAVRERYESMNDRLARIEKYVTSSRYDLDREFENLR